MSLEHDAPEAQSFAIYALSSLGEECNFVHYPYPRSDAGCVAVRTPRGEIHAIYDARLSLFNLERQIGVDALAAACADMDLSRYGRAWVSAVTRPDLLIITGAGGSGRAAREIGRARIVRPLGLHVISVEAGSIEDGEMHWKSCNSRERIPMLPPEIVSYACRAARAEREAK